MNPTIWPALGAVRFLLALIVAGSHLALFTDRNDPLARLENFSGFVAVLGFLTISGYSIAASFERDPAGFYFRRALRILPLYIPVVTLSAALPLFYSSGLSFGHSLILAPTYNELFLNLSFFQGIGTISIETNPVIWTLSIEVLFYALTPCLARLSNQFLMALICISSFAYVNSDSLVALNAQSMLLGEGVLLTGWAWLLGFWSFQAKGKAVSIAFLMGIFAITLNHAGIERWWIFTWALPFSALRYASRLQLRTGPSKFFIYMGDVSYPLYLVHFPTYLILSSSEISRTGALLVFAIAVSMILHSGYEDPLKKFLLKVIKNRKLRA